MIPVIVLTGQLGAGKTTLLQRLLASPAMAGTAVLVNEFGEIGLDHELLTPLEGEVTLLRSGCICCTVRDDIAGAIRDLIDRAARGQIPALARIVIETTGLADPFPVLSTLSADPVLRSQVAPGGVITVVDAINGPGALFDDHGMARRQVAAADVIALAKRDLSGPETTKRTLDRLHRLNPVAQLSFADAPLHRLLPQGPRDWPAPPPEGVVPITGHHHHELDGIRTLTITRAGAINWTAFGLWLTALLQRHGDRIHRVKGVLEVEQGGPPVLVNGVGYLVHPPQHLAAWPEGVPHTRLVFIFEGLDPDLIRRSFEAFDRLGHAVAPLPG